MVSGGRFQPDPLPTRALFDRRLNRPTAVPGGSVFAHDGDLRAALHDVDESEGSIRLGLEQLLRHFTRYLAFDHALPSAIMGPGSVRLLQPARSLL